MTGLAWLGEIAWKATVILGLSFIAAILLRRASAAVRHFLWTATFGVLLLIPLVESVTPEWSVRSLVSVPARTNLPATQAYRTVSPVSVKMRAVHYSLYLLLVWGLGCAVLAARFAIGAIRTRRLLQHAKAGEYAQSLADEFASTLGIHRPVKVLETGAGVPMACGFMHPTIVLPRGADGWSEQRLRTVILHELAHIRRYDLAAQELGHVSCCLYWFHPLAWLAAGELAQERERACDDVVLASGTPPEEYAAELVTIARGAVANRRSWADAPAMAQISGLESRIRALLDPTCNRAPLRRRAAAAVGAGALALLLPLAFVALHAQALRGGLKGVVRDPSGAIVVQCRVIATNQNGTNQEVTTSSALGEYRFGSIPPGNYVLEFKLPGFAPTPLSAVVAPGQVTRMDATLQMGSLSENMTISGKRPFAPASSLPTVGTQQRIRVGGNVQPSRIIYQTKPEYPAELQQLGVEGTVFIHAVISKDGNVLSPQVVNTDIDPRLARLALEAVKLWSYQPCLLDGQPVETTTTLIIDFNLN